jgi:hypothetical protein
MDHGQHVKLIFYPVGANGAQKGDELGSTRPISPNLEDDAQKQAALGYILEAWEEALHDGIEPEMLANAALFAALSDLVGVYGEDAVGKMASRLSRRIQHGEFTLRRTQQ